MQVFYHAVEASQFFTKQNGRVRLRSFASRFGDDIIKRN
jgi:hypothetical protein